MLRPGQERLVLPTGDVRRGHGDLTVINTLEAATRKILIQQREAMVCKRRRGRGGCSRRIRHGDVLRRRRRNGAGDRILCCCRRRERRNPVM